MSRWSTRRRGVLTQAGLLVAVLAGGVLAVEADAERWHEGPFVRSGAVGQEIPLGPGTVRVEGARAAERLDAGFGGELATGGVWIAVEVWATGGSGPLSAASFRLRDASGRTFEASSRVSPNSPGVAQPGSPVGADVVFELPRDAAGDVTVLVSTQPDERLAPVASVDVRIEAVAVDVLTPLPATLGPRG